MAISLTSAIPSSVKNAEYAVNAGYADNAGALSGLQITPEGAPAGSSLRNTIPRICGGCSGRRNGNRSVKNHKTNNRRLDLLNS